MSSINDLLPLTVCVMAEILCIIGVLINAFIVAVYLLNWLRRKAGTHIDQIITILGLTRICSQVISFVYISLSVFFREQNSLLGLYFLRKVDTFFNHSGSWLMTLLSVVYCLKISNFHHVFLIRLKIAVPQRVPHLIVAVALISFCYISLLCWVEHTEFQKYNGSNMTLDGTWTPKISVILMLTYLLGNSVPFILYCTSSTVVIASLSFHIHRMRLNKTQTGNLEPHYNVIKFMSLSMIYFIVNATACIMVVYSHIFYSLDLIWVYLTIDFFPNLHSMYLIQKTKKLRDSFCRIFQCGANCMLNRRGKDLTGGPVEIVMKI